MKHRILVAAAVGAAIGLPSLAAAQTVGTATVQVETKQPFGKYLADVTGRALYMFTADKKGVSNCHDRCAEMWPPMITIGPPAPGDDATASMLGTIKRPDGRLQVTYNGLPLYYYAKDQSAGATAGQDVEDSGGEWYLVAPKGTKIETAAAKTGKDSTQAQQTGTQPRTSPSQSNAEASQTASKQQPTGATQPNRSEAVTVILIDPVAANVPLVSPEKLYAGFRADALIGQEVHGPNGEEIGEVHEILASKDGQITSIVVEAGGFLEIGDAAFRIPWNELDLTPGKEGIVARKITEAKAENRGLFDGPETVLTGPREFRVGELTGDWALLSNGQGYGYVRDVVFSRDGKVLAVLVSRDARYGAGLYAYPYYGYAYGWDPGLSYYALPFESLSIAANAPKLDAQRFDKDVL